MVNSKHFYSYKYSSHIDFPSEVRKTFYRDVPKWQPVLQGLIFTPKMDKKDSFIYELAYRNSVWDTKSESPKILINIAQQVKASGAGPQIVNYSSCISPL